MTLRPKKFLLLAGILFATSLPIIYLINKDKQQGEHEKRKLKLEKECQAASRVLENGIQQFASLVSGMRSYVRSSEEIPTAEQLQQFLNEQLKDIQFTDSFVVSFLDKNHIFRYSITRNSLTVNNLAGTALHDLRPLEEMERIKAMIASDEMKLFPALNLVEGWVGIPLDFRVVKNGELVGYFAPIINFPSIIDDLYEREEAKKFVYRFSTVDGKDFDRAQVYDEVHFVSQQTDPESFKKYQLPDDDYTYCDITTYGNTFRIGVAFKNQKGDDPVIHPVSFGLIYLVLLLAAIVGMYWISQILQIKVLKTKNRELSAANKALNQFSYASSHSLREQIRSIGSFSSLLNRKYKDSLDQQGQSYLSFITNSAKQMSQILNDLAGYTRLIHTHVVQLEEVDMNKVLREIMDQQISLFGEKEIGFETDDLPVIIANQDLIRQLFQNLISNGLAYNKSHVPTIEITYQSLPGFHRFKIADNGVGIAPEYQEKVFEAFQRLDADHAFGTGLGLAICHQIVDHLGGNIYVESRPGEGSTFVISIPAHESVNRS